MRGKKNKPSRHGTLNENDIQGAVPIQVNQVVERCQTATTKDLFGDTGKLPPKAARVIEPRFIVYYTLKDDKAGLDWLGLNKVTNNEKGTVGPIALVPGEYKLELKLPKHLNRNIAHDGLGTFVGGLQSLGQSDEEKAKEIAERGLPNSYVDVRFYVQAKKYSVLDCKGILDLGVHSTFSRVFTVQPKDGEVYLEIIMQSHSVLKRLKVQGTLYRRDFAPPEPEVRFRRDAAKAGRAILQQAISSGERVGEIRTRLDADVNIHDVLLHFYKQVAPERLDNLEVVMRHFQNRDDDLINTLEAKYNVRFNTRGDFHQLE